MKKELSTEELGSEEFRNPHLDLIGEKVAKTEDDLCLVCGYHKHDRTEAMEYVCYDCVDIMMRSSMDQRKTAHAIAIRKGWDKLARGIEIFLAEVHEHEQIRPKTRKLSNRAGNRKVFRHEERSTRNIAKRKGTSFRQNHRK